MLVGRFSEVGSSISCVRCWWFGDCRIEFVGKYSFIVFRSSGSILVLVSAVVLHIVKRWTMSSVGLGWFGKLNLQVLQEDSCCLSLPRL